MLFCFCMTQNLNAQFLGEFEGPVQIITNSGVDAHLTLYEDDTASGGSTRLRMFHKDGGTDNFELRAFLDPVINRRIGFSYNNLMRVVWNEDLNGFGIGTQEPAEKLHVATSGYDGILIDGDGTGDARLWINNDNGNHYLFDDFSDAYALKISSANDFAINTGGAERFRIEETGEIAINGNYIPSREVTIRSTDALMCLEGENDNTATAVGVSGEVNGSGTGNKFGTQGIIQSGSSGTSGSQFAIYGTASATPPRSWAVYANGDFWYAGTLKSPSDERLKHNFEELNPVLDRVLQLETKSYEYNPTAAPDLNLASGRQIGFIAQNVQQYFPTLVSSENHSVKVEGGDEDPGVDILGMSYIEMIPILTKAIQEQNELIENQAELIQDMQVQIDALKSK